MISPESSIIQFGKDVKIECKNANNIVWFYESHKYSPINGPISKGAVYLIKNIKSTQTGNYFCYGKYNNKDTKFLAKTSLRVFGKWKISVT